MNRDNIILENFLTDNTVYAKNVLTWANEFRSLDISIGKSNQYISDKDGEELFYNDGNPIFNNIDFTLRKAFRIIQLNSKELEQYSVYEIKRIREIEGWVSKRTILQDGIEIEFHELVISLFLTKNSIVSVKSLIQEWYSDINPIDFNIEEYIK